MRKQVCVVEVGPRDGFQSIQKFIPTEIKLRVLDLLVEANIPKIQVTSFVSPKAIAQMQDAEYLVKTVLERYPETHWFALVPNLRGARAAVAAGIKEIGPVISLSEAHNKANVNRTRQQSLDELAQMRQTFPDVSITLDVATAFGCPFEGMMEIPPLIDFLGQCHTLGIRDITLCDTIGAANPTQIQETMRAVIKAFGDMSFGLHIHDTRNMGILNSYVGLLSGAAYLQASVGGLGGCPFAPGASGNTATEDLVYMLEKSGWDTGIDFPKLLAAARFLREQVDGCYSGHHINIRAAQNI